MLFASIQLAQSLQKALNGLLGFIPNLIGFFLILIVGYFIARLVKGIVTKLLQKAKLDHALHSGQTGAYVEKISPDASPSALIAGVVFWLIFLFVLSAAIGALKIPAVTAFMNQVLAYLPNVVVAVLIFVIAGAIAGAVGAAAAKLMGDTPTGKVVGTAIPALVMGIAVFMVLNQLRIAPAIVQITYYRVAGLGRAGSRAGVRVGWPGMSRASCSARPTARARRTRGRSSRTCRPARTAVSSTPNAQRPPPRRRLAATTSGQTVPRPPRPAGRGRRSKQ